MAQQIGANTNFSSEVSIEDLSRAIDVFADGVAVYGLNGEILHANPALRKLLSLDNDVLYGASPLRHRLRRMHPQNLNGQDLSYDDFPPVRILRGEDLAGDKAVDTMLTALDGRKVALRISGGIVMNTQGEPYCAVCILRDVTALLEAERTSAERASELETIFEAMTDSVYVHDLERRVVHMNKAGRALTESNIQEQTDLTQLTATLDLRDGEGEPMRIEQWLLNRILAGETLTNESAVDMRLRGHDGRERYVSISGAPVRDSEGRVIRSVTVIRDVTERRLLESRTRQSLNAVMEMARMLDDPSLDPDSSAEFVVASVGQRLVELARDVLGCTRISLVSFDLKENIRRPIAISGLSDDQKEEWWASVDGRPIYDDSSLDSSAVERLILGKPIVINMAVAPYNERPNPFRVQSALIAPMVVEAGLIGALSLDFGQEDHFYTSDEMTLAAAVAQLAATTIERLQLREERDDARARELALRKTTQRLDEFIAVASHELRSPLTGLRGNVQLARRRLERISADNNLSADDIKKAFVSLAELLARAETQVDRQALLINDLMDVSRIESGRLTLSTDIYEVNSVIQDCVDEVRQSWPGRSVTVTSAMEASPTVLDLNRIQQVVFNYLSNALKYSEAPNPVDVEVKNDGEAIVVTVRDFGTGLSLLQQEKVWDRYQRAGESNPMARGGLGLGLYISRALVEKHGGKVGVESSLGSGSTFWFSLPVVTTS